MEENQARENKNPVTIGFVVMYHPFEEGANDAGIIKEESMHTQFYYRVARIELSKSLFAKKIARFVVENFWNPVGSGTRSKELTDYAIAKLFHGLEEFGLS